MPHAMRLALGEDDWSMAAAATAHEGRRKEEVNEATSDKDVETDEDEALCAICFEHKPFLSLPCACKVNYCETCWDRALASSVSLRGRAQCPSCRTVFRVDFDPSARGLVFSTDASDGGTGVADWRSRLYGKAKPVQIQLLQDYGKAARRCRMVAGLPGCAASAQHGCAAAAHGSPVGRGDVCAPPQPLCVCGARLERVSSRRRVERMLQDNDSSLRVHTAEIERLVERLMNSALVTCDLCEDVATRSGAVWTCENGPHTVLHPAAYDVCERCFVTHVGPTEGPCAALAANVEVPRRPADAGASGHGHRSSQAGRAAEGDTSRCATCIAAIRRAVPLHWCSGWRQLPASVESLRPSLPSVRLAPPSIAAASSAPSSFSSFSSRSSSSSATLPAVEAMVPPPPPPYHDVELLATTGLTITV